MSSGRATVLLSQALEDVGRGHVVVVTGAGISLASGIPTFRGSDPDAVWSRDVTELGTNRYFTSDPAASWEWYLSRFDAVLDKQPFELNVESARAALSRAEAQYTEKETAYDRERRIQAQDPGATTQRAVDQALAAYESNRSEERL